MSAHATRTPSRVQTQHAHAACCTLQRMRVAGILWKSLVVGRAVASTRQPDTKKCIQVGRETYAVTSQPRTPYTFNPGLDTRTFQGQRPQPVTNRVCDDYDSIVVIDSSEPRMKPTRTTNKRKTNRTKHDRRANVQTSARPS